ncbi:hypothetical protein B0H19DRAFT_1241918 [Mycena capillaripes]|nr:hypothetical protein B0H19DRAFT_1241918 [Mycena capillaripes]
MQFFNRLRLAFTAGLVHATPVGDDTYPLVLSQVVPVGDYSLTYWSDAVSVAPAIALEERACGTNDVTRSKSRKADSGTCNQLVDQLTINGRKVVANSPRAICLGQGSDQSCVSWSAALGNMSQEDMFPAATKAYANCPGSTISGLARNVILNGKRVTECLSNRPDGCS